MIGIALDLLMQQVWNIIHQNTYTKLSYSLLLISGII